MPNGRLKYLLITEANRKVATGHLMESCELVDVLNEAGHEVFLLLNDDCPENLLQRIHCPRSFFGSSLGQGLPAVLAEMQRYAPDIIVTNLREISNESIAAMRKYTGAPIVCIDEFGRRRLDADIIINPMVDPYFWKYPGSRAKIYAGSEYLILPATLCEYHKKEKAISDEITRVCISMGGVDPFGTTVKLVRWMPEIFSGVSVDCILGGGFGHDAEFLEAAQSLPQTVKLRVLKDISNIYDYFFSADLAFCAGGNTLHELACIGVPTVVIPSMPHERNNGKMFEKMGAAKCLGDTSNISLEKVRDAVNELGLEKRKKMSICGKRCSKGKGAELTAEICNKSSLGDNY